MKGYTSRPGRSIWKSYKSRCGRPWRLRMNNFSKSRRSTASKTRRCCGSMKKTWGISRGRRNLLNRSHRRDCRGLNIKNLFNLRNLLILKLEFKDMVKIGNSRWKRFKKKKKRLKIKKKSRFRRRNSQRKYIILEWKRKKRKRSKTTNKMKGKKKRRKMLSKSLKKQKKLNKKSLWLNSKRLNSQSKNKRWNSLRKNSKNLKRKRNQKDNPKRKVLLNCQNSHQKWPKL